MISDIENRPPYPARSGRRLGFCRRRYAPLAAILALTTSGVSAQSPSASVPVFSETACQGVWYTPENAPRFRCGTVEVPRRYDGPTSDTFRIHVVTLRAREQPSRHDPLVMHGGGPGFATTLTLPAAVAASEDPMFDRYDVVFIDARGTGQSEPQLCVGSVRIWIEALAADLTTAELIAANHQETLRCRDEMRAESIEPEEFGTEVAARDLEAVRVALGIEQWNLLGSSYSALLFMTYTALYPQSVRLLLLDSPAMPDGLHVHRRDGYLSSVTALTALCEADDACRRHYPDLPGMIAETSARLEADPVVIPVDSTLGLPGSRYVVNRGDFELLLFLLLYSNDYGPIPALIHHVNAANAEALDVLPLISTGVFTGLSVLNSVAVYCRDTPYFHEPRELIFGFEMIDLNGVCAEWTRPGPLPLIPRGTSVPTLILSNSIDPATPPENARAAAEAIGAAAQHIEFRTVGHGLMMGNPCVNSIVAAKLEDPTALVDTSCASQVERIRFVAPAELLESVR